MSKRTLITLAVTGGVIILLVVLGWMAWSLVSLTNQVKELSTNIADNPVASQSPATPSPTRSQPTPEAVTAACPTTEEAKQWIGVDVQRIATENCAFVWRGSPDFNTNAICPTGFVCTLDTGTRDEIIVTMGDGRTFSIAAGTWRYIGAYTQEDAVHNVCSLYAKERAFGLKENPPFNVVFVPASIGPHTCP